MVLTVFHPGLKEEYFEEQEWEEEWKTEVSMLVKVDWQPYKERFELEHEDVEMVVDTPKVCAHPQILVHDTHSQVGQ